MQQFVLSALAESDGSPSSMRVAFLLCVLASVFLAVWPTVHGTAADTQLILTFLGVGFGGKVIQKGKEKGANGEATTQAAAKA